MYIFRRLTAPLILLVSIAAPIASRAVSAQEEALAALGGTWLYVEDRTEGRTIERQGPPMSVKLVLRVQKDAVIYQRPRGDERITLDGSAIEKKNTNGSISRYRGEWKDKALKYTLETIRLSDITIVSTIQREFRATDEGLLVQVRVNDRPESVALYRQPETIPLPTPAKGDIADVAWMAGDWVGSARSSSTEERWTRPKGGAMLGVSRTVRGESMVAFEFLRIIERDGGLVYVAQPGGRSPTEFVLVELDANRAVFLNPRHDFPQRIVYELSKAGALTASIGFAKGGRPQSFEFKREEK